MTKYAYSVAYQTFNLENNEHYSKSTWIRGKNGKSITRRGVVNLLENQVNNVVAVSKIEKWVDAK
jgi:hypothetical protein